MGNRTDEFPEPLELTPLTINGVNVARRSFLKAAGFSFAAAALSGCERPAEQKIVRNAAATSVPGRAVYYASTCGACSAACGLLVKTTDGRPIKLEGNPDHPLSHGGLCAVGQASILGLYDSQRLRTPLSHGKETTWNQIDTEVIAALKKGGAVRLLGATIHSPTTRRVIREFVSGFPDAKHIEYDALSCSAICDAYQQTHGARILPQYRLDRAQVIVSFDADFLGTWISPVQFTHDWRAGRTLAGKPPKLSLHVQVESRMSLTGAKADRRIVLSPNEIEESVAQLACAIAKKAKQPLTIKSSNPIQPSVIDELADALWRNRGKSLIASGSDRVETQLLVNHINAFLENEGKTIDLQSPSNQRRGDDAAIAALRREIAEEKIAALFVQGANPLFDIEGFSEVIKKVPLVVSFAGHLDETAKLAHLVCPEPHWLETWSDHEPVAGVVSIGQPAMNPIGQTRSMLESLCVWMGRPAAGYERVRETWTQQEWDVTVERGFFVAQPTTVVERKQEAVPLKWQSRPEESALKVVVYSSLTMLDGRGAHNAWLQELPDPITKCTWGNVASISPTTAKAQNLSAGDVLRIQTESGATIEIPVHIQPGQHDDVIAIAVGFGREGTDRFSTIGPQWLEGKPTVQRGNTIGVRVPMSWNGASVTVERTGERKPLACTQEHHTITSPIVQETTLQAYLDDPSAGSHESDAESSLWSADHNYPGCKWGMAIDMNACTGCSACVVACQVENNIPVVGRDEVVRQREMHWLRIDRYYSGPVDDKRVAFQPMMCQHCDNAGCEAVCPVLATVHSSEGLNQQVYNRCVGTRYCANNCAFKVRRFNWFDYTHTDTLQNLVLNPDVTVRSRGVME
jgi:molybdopterin-containing oxidoreductase family iron-sulfur binding subunit